MDALVAEKVMGKDPKWLELALNAPEDCTPLWKIKPYSTDIAAAWEVIERLRWLFPRQNISINILSRDDTESRDSFIGIEMFGKMRIDEQAQTLPHAICLAALKAVEYEVKDE